LVSEAIDAKVVVVGGGPAGLSAACLLAQEGVPTALVAPEPRVDQRTTALMDPSIRMLRYIGVWPGDLEGQSAPLRQLHIVDDTGNTISAPKLEFSASELSLDAFGHNIPLAALVPALYRRAASHGVKLVEASVEDIEVTEATARIKLSNGSTLTTRLVIAADGAQSQIRKKIGIDVEQLSFPQQALVTSFRHSVSHNFVSTEFHKRGGPFTTVPLPGQRSSLVWMESPERIAALNALTDEELAVEIQLESHGILGRISEVGPRATYPMNIQNAKTYAASRVLLIGEAAHQMPPIGAQGLNLSMRDAAHACDLVVNEDDPGNDRVLAEFTQLRRGDADVRLQAVGLMNASLLSNDFPTLIARVAGLTAAQLVPQLRQFVMQHGLSPRSDLPFAMRV
jgi:2-octaprenyl-6-methoxyphenol hydroxylase